MLAIGQSLGPFELVAELARGGMGALYVGRQTGLGGFSRRVPVKVIHPEIARDPDVVRMFLDEARLGGAIRHPGIVHVEAIGEHAGRPFLVMDYVEGFPLVAVLRARHRTKQHLPVEVAVALAIQIADALHAAHETSGEDGEPLEVVHRDVSPHNVLVDRWGHVRLIDFGIAKARTRLASTCPGVVKGKFAYMAPEQLESRDVDRRADVFSLGVLLWELLTLERLFAAGSDVETVIAIRHGRPVAPPSAHRPEVPPRLDDVVTTMLARSVDERFSTAAAARFALAQSCPGALGVAPAELASLRPAGDDDGAAPSTPPTR